ncbi:MAG: hypothetical protein IKC61_05785 [Clostridia bacterium]|nr:hypothetical protein [Clostridia bacterium]
MKDLTRERLIKHSEAYPNMQIKDLFKYIFQSAFGCEHLVSDLDASISYINIERKSIGSYEEPLTEQLDGSYSRVHLSCLNKGLTPRTLGKIFCLSAKTENGGREALLEKLGVARELIEQGLLPFSLSDFEKELTAWRELNYPAIRHSEAFRNEYRPAYRVVADKYVSILPLLSQLDSRLTRGRVILAIDGGCASGKTTLANMLRDIYDCTVFHMDDFFLRPEQRTAERLAEIGGNVDRERFEEEILKPLCNNEAQICYRPYNCATQELGAPVCVSPTKLVVVEGVYSMHNGLSGYYDYSVYLDTDLETRRTRISVRNSKEMAERFFNEWIPLEESYFTDMKVKERCDLIIEK